MTVSTHHGACVKIHYAKIDGLHNQHLLSNQLLYFTSKKHWRMDFFGGSVKARSMRRREGVSHYAMPLVHEEGLKQLGVHHPLTGYH
jgi:hypothetical protein